MEREPALHRKLILDTDGGVDDAQALLMLIAHGRTPDVIVTVFGNVGLDAATRNVLATLAVAGTEVPVYKGAARPLVEETIDAREIHGEDGLGGAPRPPVTAEPAGDDGVLVLCRMLARAAAEGELVDILAIGPLTNLALALRVDPGIVRGIGRLVIMGGTLWGRGNVTPAAEFNIFADPEAASIVLGSGIEMTVVPWEPCRTHRITGAEVDAIFATRPQTPLKLFSEALVRHARHTALRFGASDVFRFVDPFAAAVLIDPAIVTKSLSAALSVSLAPGPARGMMLVDPSASGGRPRATLVEAADLSKLVALYAASVGG